MIRYRCRTIDTQPRQTDGGQVHRMFYLLVGVLLLISILWRSSLLVVVSLVLLLLLAMTELWARMCLHEIKIQRRLSEQRVFFGEKIQLSFIVENAKFLPLPWLEVEDEVPRVLKVMRGDVEDSVVKEQGLLTDFFSLRWYERITRHYNIQCVSRGVYTFGPTQVKSGDIFGFVVREGKIENEQHLLVYPLMVPLEQLHLPARHPFGEQRVPRRLLEDPARVVGIRDYAYGDSWRAIHWKATARTLQLQSKVYEPTTTYTLSLFLNVNMRIDAYYGIYPELQELAICVTASLVQWGVNQGYAVGLYANSFMSLPEEMVSPQQYSEQELSEILEGQVQRRRIIFPAASGEEQRLRLLEALARAQAYFVSGIEDILQAERTHLPIGSTVVIVTAVISEGLVDNLVQLQHRGCVVAIVFVGDTPPPMKLAGIQIHHVGGSDLWKRLCTQIFQKDEMHTHPFQDIQKRSDRKESEVSYRSEKNI